MNLPTIDSAKRDTAVVSAMVASLIASGVLSGTAETITVAVLSALTAGLAAFTNPTRKDKGNARREAQ